ncbi:SDR family oxidoreductase [Streptomyces sp. MST-110588]|uniref:SDR family NAD(P)-dependent oxidoreductase n=1 Tax=Streptomyces sp. MST-110588 TaxID=2833628 RepID=UPI001F5CE789|nr:SDR family oxidoreductase [Streptomyces sp. MST-110588]UNO41438.1 SDR family oxidoreductase [Streptomyces sp. MST-110588]
MGKLDGRVVIVTGAARGQGEQEARLFAAEGAKVVLGDVLDGPGQALADELGGDRARYLHLDVSREADWEAAVGTATAAFGKLDGLVNNAGILRFNALVDTPLAEFRQLVEINQIGAFLGMRAVVPELVAAGGGTIVNTASYTALSGMAYLTSYAATKAAIVGMTRVAAMELADRGIRVNAMCPGAIDTPMTNPDRVAAYGGPKAAGDGDGDGDGAGAGAGVDGDADAVGAATRALEEFYGKAVPMGRIGRPEEVARLALFLTCADSSYITGQPFVIDGGWLAGIPVL